MNLYGTREHDNIIMPMSLGQVGGTFLRFSENFLLFTFEIFHRCKGVDYHTASLLLLASILAKIARILPGHALSLSI